MCAPAAKRVSEVPTAPAHVCARHCVSAHDSRVARCYRKPSSPRAVYSHVCHPQPSHPPQLRAPHYVYPQAAPPMPSPGSPQPPQPALAPPASAAPAQAPARAPPPLPQVPAPAAQRRPPQGPHLAMAPRHCLYAQHQPRHQPMSRLSVSVSCDPWTPPLAAAAAPRLQRRRLRHPQDAPECRRPCLQLAPEACRQLARGLGSLLALLLVLQPLLLALRLQLDLALLGPRLAPPQGVVLAWHLAALQRSQVPARVLCRPTADQTTLPNPQPAPFPFPSAACRIPPLAHALLAQVRMMRPGALSCRVHGSMQQRSGEVAWEAGGWVVVGLEAELKLRGRPCLLVRS